MEFLEELPELCPPAEAKESQYNPAFRVVQKNPPSLNCFDSQAKRNRPLLPEGDACKHASCSLFTDEVKIKNIASRLPKPRFGGSLIATMNLPEYAGKSIHKKKHIDFWFYKNFNPVQAVVSVEEILDV